MKCFLSLGLNRRCKQLPNSVTVEKVSVSGRLFRDLLPLIQIWMKRTSVCCVHFSKCQLCLMNPWWIWRIFFFGVQRQFLTVAPKKMFQITSFSANVAQNVFFLYPNSAKEEPAEFSKFEGNELPELILRWVVWVGVETAPNLMWNTFQASCLLAICFFLIPSQILEYVNHLTL